MELSLIFMKRFKDTVERILHVPGNFTGPVLEMAVVLDGSLSRDVVSDVVPQLLGSLKRHSEVFRNVRLNVVNWKSDERIDTEVRPLSVVMLNSFYDGYEQEKVNKHFEALVAYLKMFQARSKVILLITDGKYQVENEDTLEISMRPFLEKKLLQVIVTEQGEAEVRYRFQRTI